jgi:hypothetical protein
MSAAQLLFSTEIPGSAQVEGSDSSWSRKMTSRRPARDDFRSQKAVRRPGKDPRQTENPGGQADISCQTDHRRGFSFDDHGFRKTLCELAARVRQNRARIVFFQRI